MGEGGEAVHTNLLQQVSEDFLVKIWQKIIKNKDYSLNFKTN